MIPDDVERSAREAPVARMATIGPSGAPDIVPITFAAADDVIYTAVDHKPKRTRNLRRLANIERDPRVTVLIDHYDDNWTRLWWCRLRGVASILHGGADLDAGVTALRAKYDQYREHPPEGPLIAIRVTGRRIWTAVG